MKLKKMASFFLAITTVFCASASVMAADFSPNSNTESLRAAKVAAAAEIAYLDVKTAAPALKPGSLMVMRQPLPNLMGLYIMSRISPSCFPPIGIFLLKNPIRQPS